MTTRRPSILALAPLVLLASLCPGPVGAQLRYVMSADLRESYNSQVLELEQGSSSGASWDLVTELEPSARLYYARARSLFALAYRLQMSIYSRTTDPERGGPLVGYGNHMNLSWNRLLSRDSEIGVANQFTQGTENTTWSTTLTQNGTVTPLAPRLGIGTRYILDTLPMALRYTLDPRWLLQITLAPSVYYPYASSGPEETVGPLPTLGVNLLAGVTRTFNTASLLLSLESAVLADYIDPDHKTSFGVPPVDHHLFPDFWMTYVIGATVGWHQRINAFLDADVRGGAALRRMDQLDANRTYVSPVTAVSPVGEASIRYHRGENFDSSLAYSHGWTRQPELGQASTTETDAVTLHVLYGTRRWTFEAVGAFMYMRSDTFTADQDERSKGASAHATISRGLWSGVSLEASYLFETLFDRTRGFTTYDNVSRHIATLGISLVWPPPPPQDLRLSHRESAHDPTFAIGAEGGGEVQGGEAESDGGEAAGAAASDEGPTETRWQPVPEDQAEEATTEPEAGEAAEAADRDRPTEEEPPLPEREEEASPDVDGYYSWPR